MALGAVALGAWLLRPQPGEQPPMLSVATAAGSEAVAPLADALDAELRVVLGRYRTVALGAPGAQGDYHLAAAIRGSVESPRISVELTERESGHVVHADALDGAPGEQGLGLIAARLGATVASPIGGAITTRVSSPGKAWP